MSRKIFLDDELADDTLIRVRDGVLGTLAGRVDIRPVSSNVCLSDSGGAH